MARLVAVLRSPLTAQLGLLVLLVVLGRGLAPSPGDPGPVPRALFDQAPYLLAAAACGAALFFQSANAALLAALLALGHGYIGFDPPIVVPLLAPPSLRPELVAVALPAAAAVLIGFSDRGLWNRHGALRAALVLGGFVALLVAVYAWPGAAGYLRRAAFLPSGLAALIRLSDPALVASLAGLGATAFLAYRRATAMAMAMAVAVAAAWLALAVPMGAASTVAFTASAQAVLLMGALQSGYRLAFFDQLTGLPNRRALDLELKRLSGDYSLAMMDVDHFKSFNDKYGHEAGDHVLKLVARVVGAVGGGGKPYRYGGEEFCVVFPGRDPQACQEPLEALRSAVADKPYVLRQPAQRPQDPKQGQKQRSGQGRTAKPQQKTVPITISIGVAGPSGLTDAPEAVLKRADEALYKAKKAGRNCLKRAG